MRCLSCSWLYLTSVTSRTLFYVRIDWGLAHATRALSTDRDWSRSFSSGCNHFGTTTPLVVALLALAAGAGLFAYRYVTNPVTLTVAAGSLDGDVPRFMAALASRMSSSDAGVRLKVVDKGTAWEAAKAFSAGDVDLAVVKSRCRRSISGADRGCRYTRCRTDRCASGNFYLGYG
jgi:hypothetical protein